MIHATQKRLRRIPEWIRNVHLEEWFPVDKYLNAFELLSADERRLFGTESMYGDWGARVLLVLQDWCDSQELIDRIGNPAHRHHADPWCHSPEIKTNRLLRRAFGPDNSPGLLYSSALGALLKRTPRKDDPPPSFSRVQPFLIKVMDFALRKLPDDLVVVCFGRIAEKVVAGACEFRSAPTWEDRPPAWVPANRSDGRRIRVFSSPHPRMHGFDSIDALGRAVIRARDEKW